MNPSNPPAYDAIYTHGVRTYPVPVHGQIHPGHPVLMQPQSQVILQVPIHQQPGYGGPVMIAREMDSESIYIVCHNCNYSVSTRTEMKPALRTHCCAACMCFIGLWPCCIVPYCIPSCNDVDHYCPKCNAYIGSYTG